MEKRRNECEPDSDNKPAHAPFKRDQKFIQKRISRISFLFSGGRKVDSGVE